MHLVVGVVLVSEGLHRVRYRLTGPKYTTIAKAGDIGGLIVLDVGIVVHRLN